MEWEKKKFEPNILLKFSACSTFSSFSFHLENLDIKKAWDREKLFNVFIFWKGRNFSKKLKK